MFETKMNNLPLAKPLRIHFAVHFLTCSEKISCAIFILPSGMSLLILKKGKKKEPVPQGWSKRRSQFYFGKPSGLQMFIGRFNTIHPFYTEDVLKDEMTFIGVAQVDIGAVQQELGDEIRKLP